MKTSWHVATAAEAFARHNSPDADGMFRFNTELNQPEYDLVAADGERMLKVSVKGSQDGKWGLDAILHRKMQTITCAADKWLAKHGKKTVFCLVQFKNTSIYELPRMYLATPIEIADWLKKAAAGRGTGILAEKQVWTRRAHAAGTTDEIPRSWEFTAEEASGNIERRRRINP